MKCHCHTVAVASALPQAAAAAALLVTRLLFVCLKKFLSVLFRFCLFFIRFLVVEKCSHQFSLLTTADTAASATVLHVFDNRNFSSVAVSVTISGFSRSVCRFLQRSVVFQARLCVGRRYKTQSPAVRSSTIQSVSVHQYFTVTIIFNSVNTELVVHDSVLRRATYGDLQRRNVTTHSLLYAPKNRLVTFKICLFFAIKNIN